MTELSMIELNHACPTPRCVWKRLVIDVGNGLDRSRNDGGGDRFGMALVKRPVYIYILYNSVAFYRIATNDFGEYIFWDIFYFYDAKDRSRIFIIFVVY